MSTEEPPEPTRITIGTSSAGREPREKRLFSGFKLDLDLEPLVLPGIIAGGLVFVAVYKDEITKLIEKISGIDLDIKLPPVKIPTIPKPDGGGTTTGSQWYKANGPTVKIPASRQDGQSNRWSKNVSGWSNGFEVMGYLTVTGMQSGSHIGLKMGGPNHSGNCGHKEQGSCCCWWDGGLRRDGKSYLEIEYPHPHNLKEKFFASMGRNIDGGVLGVRWLNMKEGNGRRVMFWVDKSGKVNAHKWTLLYNVLDTGQFMPTSYYNKIPNELELEIRISDVSPSKIKWHTGPIGRKIGIGGGSTTNLSSTYIPLERVTVA